MAKADIFIKHHNVRCPCGKGEVQTGCVDYNKMYAGADPWSKCICVDCDEKYEFSSTSVASDLFEVHDRKSRQVIGVIRNGEYKPS